MCDLIEQKIQYRFFYFHSLYRPYQQEPLRCVCPKLILQGTEIISNIHTSNVGDLFQSIKGLFMCYSTEKHSSQCQISQDQNGPTVNENTTQEGKVWLTWWGGDKPRRVWSSWLSDSDPSPGTELLERPRLNEASAVSHFPGAHTYFPNGILLVPIRVQHNRENNTNSLQMEPNLSSWTIIGRSQSCTKG